MQNKLKEVIKDAKIGLVVFDSDGVLVPRGTQIREKFNGNDYELWFSTKVVSDRIAQKINWLKETVPVCISSGRSMLYLESIYAKVKDGVIFSAENGSLVNIQSVFMQEPWSNTDWRKIIKKLTDIKEDIKELEHPEIKGFEPKQFILTVHAESELKEVYDIVAKHDPIIELDIMWNGEAFDIQKIDTSKGNTIIDLANDFGIEKENIIAIGDRKNDEDMVKVAGIGISADKKHLKADYYLEGELPGEELLDILLEK